MSEGPRGWLPGNLLGAASKRAGELGYSSLNEYLLRLIEADLAAGGAHVISAVDRDDLARRGLRLVSTAEAGRLIGAGPSYIAVLKNAAGVKGSLVSVPTLLKYQRDNPGFTTRWAGVDDPLTPEEIAEGAAMARELRNSRPGRRPAASGRSGVSTR